MRASSLIVGAFATAVALGGCPAPLPASSVPVDAGLAPAPPPPAPLALTLSGTGLDGGTWSVPLETGTRATVEPSATLTVNANRGLHNYRVRIFDEADRALESDDEELPSGSDGLGYRMALTAPLLPGHRYALLVDGQTPGPFLDRTGETHDELRFELLVAGERVKPAPPPRKKRRRR